VNKDTENINNIRLIINGIAKKKLIIVIINNAILVNISV
jgi:hypothetical protein